MTTAGISSGHAGLAGDGFITGASSVAALDTPQLTQTKIEIRSLVAEIAELSASDVELPVFAAGMLPRLCTAMGASAAAIWQISPDQRFYLQGHHNLPLDLCPPGQASDQASDQVDNQVDGQVDGQVDEQAQDQRMSEAALAHQNVLACVAAESAPILVPPKSVRIAADRPINPLDQALLVVPIKIHERVDTLLEVIQPASGGPAAQRGYLRFVAQMADLLADFLRRQRLRAFSQKARYTEQLQTHLLAISSASTQEQRYQRVASALNDLLGTDMVLIVDRYGAHAWWPLRSKWRVRAISGVPNFDSRSEIVIAAQQLMHQVERQRRLVTPAPAIESDAANVSASADVIADGLADATADSIADGIAAQLRQQIGCDRLVRLSISEHFQALLAVHASCDFQQLSHRVPGLIGAFGALVQATSTSSPMRGFAADWLPWHSRSAAAQSAPAQRSLWARLERGLVRTSSVLLVLAIVCFPMPDHISSVAVLEATDKELYYAPSTASVGRVLVDSDQVVKQGQPLIELVDQQLESRLDELEGQRQSTAAQMEQDRLTLLGGAFATPLARDELESRLEQSTITLRSLDDQLTIVRGQMEQLSVNARRDAVITTWDARNRLQGRPVAAGQLLLTACAPDAAWQLRLSIPERQAGRVQDALTASAGGLVVQFSLSSHPSEVRTGRLISLSKQLIKDEDGTSKVIGIVAVDGRSLPAKTDGAVARAAIDCGRTYAGWLVVRDAYREASAWWRLNW